MGERVAEMTKKIEEAMACTAYAEAGEPCLTDHEAIEAERKKATASLGDTMACTAFAEADEPCPIKSEEAAAPAE